MSLSERLEKLFDKLDNFEEKLTEIEEKMKTVLEKEESIKKALEENAKDCKKMSNHITFVERAYSALRSPLNFITGKFNSNNQLPELEN